MLSWREQRCQTHEVMLLIKAPAAVFTDDHLIAWTQHIPVGREYRFCVSASFHQNQTTFTDPTCETYSGATPSEESWTIHMFPSKRSNPGDKIPNKYCAKRLKMRSSVYLRIENVKGGRKWLESVLLVDTGRRADVKGDRKHRYFHEPDFTCECSVQWWPWKQRCYTPTAKNEWVEVT
jgi:hypothetical protein